MCVCPVVSAGIKGLTSRIFRSWHRKNADLCSVQPEDAAYVHQLVKGPQPCAVISLSLVQFSENTCFPQSPVTSWRNYVVHQKHQELLDSTNKSIFAAGSFLNVMPFFLKWRINPGGPSRAASMLGDSELGSGCRTVDGWSCGSWWTPGTG